VILQRCNMSLGNGLGRLADRVFRIGHLGDFNDSMTTATLSGIEMGLKICGVPHRPGGVEAALSYLVGNAGPVAQAA
jgi:alanine-glyoxylate transaminase/serine-glyoxylate transaminase/serine-pyruvate transaminase